MLFQNIVGNRDPGKEAELQQQHTLHRLHHSLQVRYSLKCK